MREPKLQNFVEEGLRARESYELNHKHIKSYYPLAVWRFLNSEILNTTVFRRDYRILPLVHRVPFADISRCLDFGASCADEP